MVGAVLVRPVGGEDRDGRGAGCVLGEGHHARCGGAHAERVAIADALRRGCDLRGATLYVTLAPCCGTGRTPPCTDAIIEAGVARVVFAREDAHPKGRDARRVLEAAGVRVDLLPEPAALAVGESFAHRVERGLPWVIAKWAQSVDGRIATSSGESRWISGERSRAMVHRERGRVDAILTGIGTVLADDPLLTARGVRRRRVALRVVLDRRLRLPLRSRLVASARDVPLIVFAEADRIGSESAAALRGSGVELRTIDRSPTALATVLRGLAATDGVSTLLVEAGPKLLGALLREGLLCEAWIFTAGRMFGDDLAPGPVGGGSAAPDFAGATGLATAPRFRLVDLRRRGGDAMSLWRRAL